MKKAYPIFNILLVIIPFFGFSQLHWKRVNYPAASLPKSIRIFKTTDSLNGRPFIAWCAEVRLTDKHLDFTTQTGNGKRYTPSQYDSMEAHPYLVLNGAYFSYQSNQNMGVVMRNGKMEAYNVPALKSLYTDSFYYPTRSAFGISKKRWPDVAWLFTDSTKRWPYAFQSRPVVAKGSTPDPSIKDLHTLDQWKWWKMETAIGGGPVLVQDGVVYITNKEEQLLALDYKDVHPRSAIGYTRNRRMIILVIQGRSPGLAEGATLEEEARILVELGCIEALNLDGGGSSCLLVNGKETIQPSDKEGQRPVASVFIVKKRERK